MRVVTLGRTGPAVGAVGLGCMGMSPGIYGPSDDAESVATIRAAIEARITLLDTGDFYGMGHNEMLIRRALEGVPRSRVVISVKFGAIRNPAGGWGGYDCRPQAVKNFLAYTLRRVGTRSSEPPAPRTTVTRRDMIVAEFGPQPTEAACDGAISSKRSLARPGHGR